MKTTSLDDRVEVLDDRVEVGDGFLYISPDSRDAIVSAESFLLLLKDSANDVATKMGIDRVILHLSNMLYGFDDDEEEKEP